MKEYNIDELLNKYFEGETSLEEEYSLKEYFNQSRIPEKYEKYSGHFKFLLSESQNRLEDSDVIADYKIERIKINRNNLIFKIGYTITAVAAVAAILIMAYTQYSSLPDKSLKLDFLSQDTYKDPELAYAETKKTLLYVSEKLNDGMEPLEKLSEFDKSLNELEKISDFNKYQSLIFKGDKYNEN
jgi:hypothetical protein